ncbi:MAG: heme A synthase [Cyanobacteria bacterium P01_A01_bin.3]
MQNTYFPPNEGSPTGETSINVKPAIVARFRLYVFALAGITFFLMALGSATRVMNAGLSCPDWPLCFGEVIPRDRMTLQVFLEWFHRVIATSVGVGAIALVGSSWGLRKHLPVWLPWAALGALGLVVFQGILGGLTVTELLRFDIVTAHLGTGLLFFSLLLSIGIGLTRLSVSSSSSSKSVDGTQGRQSSELVKAGDSAIPAYLPWVGTIATVAIYGQSILGALVASQWALHLCFGESELCRVMNAHLLGILPAATATLSVAIATWIAPTKTAGLRRLSYLATLLLIAQLAVGTATYRLHLQVEPLTVTHQAIGAALLGTLLCFTLLAWRLRLQTSGASGEQDRTELERAERASATTV